MYLGNSMFDGKWVGKVNGLGGAGRSIGNASRFDFLQLSPRALTSTRQKPVSLAEIKRISIGRETTSWRDLRPETLVKVRFQNFLLSSISRLFSNPMASFVHTYVSPLTPHKKKEKKSSTFSPPIQP